MVDQNCHLLCNIQAILLFHKPKNIQDNYPKYVLSMDKLNFSRDGIIHSTINQSEEHSPSAPCGRVLLFFVYYSQEICLRFVENAELTMQGDYDIIL